MKWLEEELPNALSSKKGSDYRFIVSPGWQRPQAHLYAFNLRQTIPDCPVPIKPDEANEPVLALQTLLHTLYAQAGYDLRIDYHLEPVPPLIPSDAAWVDDLLRRARLRE